MQFRQILGVSNNQTKAALQRSDVAPLEQLAYEAMSLCGKLRQNRRVSDHTSKNLRSADQNLQSANAQWLENHQQRSIGLTKEGVPKAVGWRILAVRLLSQAFKDVVCHVL